MQIQRSTRANAAILAVAGRLDATTAPSLEGALQAELRAGTTLLAVELGEVQLISSAALRVLVSAAKQARSQGGRIALCALTPEVARVFGMSGLSSLFDLCPALPDALAALGVADEPAPPAVVEPPASDAAFDQPSDITADMPPFAVRGEMAAPPVDEAAPEPPPVSAPVESALPPPVPPVTPDTPPPPVRRTLPPPPPVFDPPPSGRVPHLKMPSAPALAAFPPSALAALLADPRRRPVLIGAACGVAALGLILVVAGSGRHHGSSARKVVAANPPPVLSTPGEDAARDGSATPAEAVNPPPPPPAPPAATETPGAVAATETVSVPPRGAINLDTRAAENQQTRQDVLKRIDFMPVSPAQRDRLYQSLDHARGLGKIITIQFANGRADLNDAAVSDLKAALQRPDIANLLSNPAAVVIVLGYADAKGSAQLNKETSQRRAERVLAVLRGPCAVPNVMHAVGMGGGEFFDPQHLEKNRVAEVWAVLP